MINKKLMMLTIIIVSLFAVSAVSAAENVTGDVGIVDDATELINSDVDLANVDNLKRNDEQEILVSGGLHDNLSQNKNEDVLSYSSPTYSQYSVSVSNTVVNYGSSGTIKVNINPCTKSGYYKYDFYLKIYDSNGNQKYSHNYYSSSSTTSESYTFSSGTYASGNYDVKIVNYADSRVMATAKLTIKSSSIVSSYPSYTDYTVSVSDTTIYYGSSGSIYMSISPSSKTSYKYYYYLKVYDSAENEMISKVYYGSASAYSKTYSVSSNQLNPGNYIIRIVNYYDSKEMATAKLTVKPASPLYSDYSVAVSDTTINYGSSGSISMKISPASSNTYKYDYYLKVYDSNNNEKISTRFYSSSSANSKTYSISSKQLNPGTYTINIINSYDNQVMSTAKLTIKKVTLETKDVVGKCDEIIEYRVRASENGIYKSGLSITFDCNGNKNTILTDSDGYATLKIHLKAGTYKIKTESINDFKENTLEVKKVFVENKYKGVYVKSLTDYFKGKKKIKFGWKGNLLGHFKIYKGNKLVFQTKLNSNGYINDYFKYASHNRKYSISKFKQAGIYKAVITNKQGKTLAKAKINIKKAPTHIKCSSFLTKVGSKKSIKVYVYDKSKSRKHVVGAVKVKINGKTYKAKVKKGFAVIKNVKFPLKVKTYVGNVKFLANKNYKSSSKKFKVGVRKLTSEIYAYSKNTKTGAKTTLVAHVDIKNLKGDYSSAKGGKVKFSLNGATYYAKIKNGKAKVRITAPYYTGTYRYKAVYLGSQSIKGSSDESSVTVKPRPAPVVKFRSPTSGATWKIKKSTWEKMKSQARSEYWHMRSIGSSYPGYSHSINVKVTLDGYVYKGIALAIKNDRSLRCEIRGIYGMRITNLGDY